MVVVGLACTGLFASFVNSASPYMSIDEAKNAGGTKVHLVGEIVPNSIQTLPRERSVIFQLVDAKGARVTVRYRGNAPAALATATRVDAIGTMQGAEFHSEKLLLKCPSKYESKSTDRAR